MNKKEGVLIGLHIGDGSLYKTNTGVVWELRGGLDEVEFYDSYIVPLVNEILGLDIVAKKRSGGKNGCYGVRCSNRKALDFFLQVNIFPGKKVNTAHIPNKVFTSNSGLIGCLQGLFATDGAIYLAKINGSEKSTYPIIEFASVSRVLRDQIVEILAKFHLVARVWTYNGKYLPCFYLRLAGKSKVKLFSERIGFINYKHQRKFEEIKQYL